MVEQLFGSKTRVKLLKLFYSNPNRPFYVREITRKIDEQINSVRRELANLLSIGIISSEDNSHKLYYEVNQKYEYYDPLAAIFGGAELKPKATVAETDQTAGDITGLGNVDLAIFTGQFTRDEKSGVDFLIIGDVNPTQVAKYVAELETQEGKELRYVVMDIEEFYYRKQVNDRFLSLVLDSKMQVLLDRHYLISAKPKAEPKTEPKKESKKKVEKE